MKNLIPALPTFSFILFCLSIISCTNDSDVFELALQEEIAENLEEEADSDSEEESDDDTENSDTENDDNQNDTNNEDNISGDDLIDDESNKGVGISFADFGVVGNGSADDTAALQAAFNSGSDLFATSPLILKVTATINLRSSNDQNIDWNNSTIEVESTNLVTFIIDKPNGAMTAMNDLTIEGNSIGQDGFQVHSPIEFENIDVQNLYSATNAPQAFAIFFDGNFTRNSKMNNCDCTNLDGFGNNVIGDAIGATRCFGFYVDGIPNNRSSFTVSNFDFGEVWSEDGDVIEILDGLFEETGSDIGETYSPLLIENGTISNWGRRGVKGTGGGYIIRNVVFEPADASNSNLPSSSKLGPSGIIAMGHTYYPSGSGSNGTYGIASGGIIENCVFNGSSYDTQVILTRSDELIFRNNILRNGADLQFQQNPRDIYLCGNQFESGSIIYEQGPVFSPNLSNIQINSDNSFSESDYNRLGVWNSSESSFSCPD